MSCYPDSITGKQFEADILFRAGKMEEQGVLTMNRYGVQAVMMNSKQPPFRPEWQVIPSLPDFDSCLMGGRQMIIEAKVCSGPSYPIWHKSKEKSPKQIDHMLRRARFNALCYLMIHFNGRKLVKSSEPPETIAIPVHPDDQLWRMYAAAEVRSISREEARMRGITVPWDAYSPRASKLTPNLSKIIPPASANIIWQEDLKLT